MISCKQATELISKAMEEPLSLTESIALKIHLFVCECCEQFKKQLHLVRAVFRRHPEDEAKSLSSAAKDRMHRAIDDPKNR